MAPLVAPLWIAQSFQVDGESCSVPVLACQMVAPTTQAIIVSATKPETTPVQQKADTEVVPWEYLVHGL